MPFDLPDQLNNVGPEQQSQALWIGLYVPKSRGDAPPDKYIAPIMISSDQGVRHRERSEFHGSSRSM